MSDMRRLATILVVAALGLGPATAVADGPPSRASKSKVAKAAAKPTKKAFVGTDTEKTIFRSNVFGASDSDAEQQVKKLVERCAENPFTREGMDEVQAARCNAEVAKAVRRGERIVGPILRFLERDTSSDVPSSEDGYYARTRLFHVLGRVDSPALEEELLAGMTRIAKGKLDDRASDVDLAHTALVQMNGVDPTGRAVAAAGAAESAHTTTARRVAAWRSFLADHDGEPKAKVRATMLTGALPKATSKDVGERYLALSALAAQSPRRAQPLLDKAVDEVPEDEQEAFGELQSLAYALAPPVVELPRPRPRPPTKSAL